MVPRSERAADVREMVMAHDMFRREFGLMPDLVRAVAPGDRARLDIVAGHVELIVLVLGRHQHGEDTEMWPRLLDRVPEGDRPLVRVMQEQHGPLDDLVVELAVALGEWRDESAADAREAVGAVAATAARERLAGTLDLVNAALREHLADEERLVLPLIEQYVTAAEWEQMVQAEADATPPDSVALIFGMLMYEADPLVVEAIIGGMPPEVRPVLKQVAEGAYAAHAKRVHGTGTPPRIGVEQRRNSGVAGAGV